MPILYALVARGKNVLAEYTSAQGNFPTVTRVLLSKIPEQDGKMSYVYDSHVFHYIVDNDEIKRLWRQEFTAIEQTALAFSLNDQFSPILRQQIHIYNTNPTPDNISKVKQQIDNVKDVMVDNIDRVLERGEKIELLVDKTDKLSHQAYKFEKTSRNLKNSMYCKRFKLYALIFFVLGLIGFFIAAMFCGFNFKECKN